MKKYLFPILFLFSCQPDTDITTLPPCQEEGWGHLKVTNSQSEVYEFYIDGQLRATLTAGQVQTFVMIAEGEHKLEASEVEFTNEQRVFLWENFNVFRCTTNEVEF